jgi:SAM-dependent methyltransferase
MTEPVDLYDSHYGMSEDPVYRAVRQEAFGEDLGQTSWITAVECNDYARWLGLAAGQRLLEVACGNGGVSIRFAKQLGIHVVGMDIHHAAITAAEGVAVRNGLQDRVEFRAGDANDALPFPDGSFDALFCNDAINHLRDRAGVLAEWHRVLRPGGRCLYTDPVVVTGLSNADRRKELDRLSSSRRQDSRALLDGRFSKAARRRHGRRIDVVAALARRPREAEHALVAIEGRNRFHEFQGFLATVHALASERRLSRYCYVGEKIA